MKNILAQWDNQVKSLSTTMLLAEYARTRDATLRQELIVRHLSLVSRLARRFSAYDEETDDLVQVGCIGLINAIDRYEPDKGTNFLAFAIPTITGEMRRYLRDKANLVRLPRRLQGLRAQVNLVTEHLSQELGHSPTTTDLAAAFPEEEAAELEAATQPVLSVSLDESETSTLASRHYLGVEDAELARSEDRTAVRQVLTHLSPKERVILYLRFYEGLSQARVARLLGISQMHVSRWERRALERLRQALAPT